MRDPPLLGRQQRHHTAVVTPSRLRRVANAACSKRKFIHDGHGAVDSFDGRRFGLGSVRRNARAIQFCAQLDSPAPLARLIRDFSDRIGYAAILHPAPTCPAMAWFLFVSAGVDASGKTPASPQNPVKPPNIKIFHFTEIRNCGINPYPGPRRGAIVRRHGSWAGVRWTRQCWAQDGAGWAGSPCEPEAVCRRTALKRPAKLLGEAGLRMRTAKPCGPGRHCYGQALRRCGAPNRVNLIVNSESEGGQKEIGSRESTA